MSSDILPVHYVQNFHEIGEERTVECIDVLSIIQWRVETSLAVDQTFEMLFDGFQDEFNYYYCDGKQLPNTLQIIALKTSAFLRNPNDHPLLPPSGKDLRLPAYQYRLEKQIFQKTGEVAMQTIVTSFFYFMDMNRFPTP